MAQSNAYRVIYVTCPNRGDALRIGRFLVQQRLVASANVVPSMTAVYWWEGKLREGEESILIAKTRAALAERVVAAVKDQHEFDVPCIIVLPILGGARAYLDWIAEQTRERVRPAPTMELVNEPYLEA